jgi:hypothetical protein
LILSADDRAHDKTRHLGPCGLVRKPFDADDLIAAVLRGLVGDGVSPTRAGPSGARPADDEGHGGEMAAVDPMLAALIAELRSCLEAGALSDLGPIMLKAGPLPNAELAGRIVLADATHLSELAEHTGHPPASERWALLADDVQRLLLHTGRRREVDGDR